MIEVHGSHWPRKEILCTVDEFLVNSGYAEYFKPKVFESFLLKMIHVAEVNGIGGLMPTKIFESEVEEMRWYAANKI